MLLVRLQRSTRFFIPLAVFASACSGAGSPSQADAGTDSGSGSSNSNGVWTVVDPVGTANTMPGNVTGLWFGSTTSGVVSFDTGLIDHFDAADHVDAVALDGFDMLPGPDSDAYFGVTQSSLGVVAFGESSANLIVSSDDGKTFSYGKMFGSTASGGTDIPLNEAAYWLGSDGSGAWHIAEQDGGLWVSPTAPGSAATFTLTWHPDGAVTVPATIPDGDCAGYTGNSYYASRPGPVFAASANGSNLVYGGNNEGAGPPQICHSSDGGRSFQDVTGNVSPASFSSENYPWLYLYTSNTNAIGAFGSELSGASTTYVLYSTDGGTHWTQGALPASAANMTTLVGAFATPSGSSLFLVGDGYGLYPGAGDVAPVLLLYKSSDGGQTWTDLSAKLANLPDEPLRLSNGFALDDDHVWVGGEGGFVAYSSTGGE
jgi:hypothetical protein